MDICTKCGSITTCCDTARVRREDAESLGRLVNRQSTTITRLTRERDEARQVANDLRGVAA